MVDLAASCWCCNSPSIFSSLLALTRQEFCRTLISSLNCFNSARQRASASVNRSVLCSKARWKVFKHWVQVATYWQWGKPKNYTPFYSNTASMIPTHLTGIAVILEAFSRMSWTIWIPLYRHRLTWLVQLFKCDNWMIIKAAHVLKITNSISHKVI